MMMIMEKWNGGSRGGDVEVGKERGEEEDVQWEVGGCECEDDVKGERVQDVKGEEDVKRTKKLRVRSSNSHLFFF